MKSMTLSAVAFRSVKVSQIQTVLFSPPHRNNWLVAERFSGSHAGGIGAFAISRGALGYRTAFACHMRS